MKPLGQKEIEEAIINEGEVKKPNFMLETSNIPQDAHSVFSFKIEEDIEDLLDQIMNPKRQKIDTSEYYARCEQNNVYINDPTHSHKPEWHFKDLHKSGEKTDDADYAMIDVDDAYYSAYVKKTDEGLKITTATGRYVYDIKKDNYRGCSVEFHGPINGILQQTLLPTMTYREGTLLGKFVSNDETKDLTPFMDMEEYGILRARKNEDAPNRLDEFGYKINKKVNNEIPFFPKSLEIDYTRQEIKNMSAQKDFKDDKKTSKHTIENAKERIYNHLEKNKEMTADIKEGMAKTKESGYKHISRTPTPNKGGRED